MTTQKQILANRRNSTLSTGPSSEAGKAASSKNAVKHSMTAQEFLFESDREKVEAQYAGWCISLRPVGEVQEWLARRVVTVKVRLERCEDHEGVLRHIRAARVDVDGMWEVDRRAEIEVLADGLSRRPAVVAAKLSQSLYGCEWLLIRWRILRDAVAGEGTPRPLNDEERSLAFDLLGLRPEQRQGRSVLDLPAGTGGDDGRIAAHQAAVIAGQIDRLEGFQEGGLRWEDEVEQIHVRHGVGELAHDRQLRLAVRYRDAARREMYQAWDDLKQLQKEAAAGLKETPVAPPSVFGRAPRVESRTPEPKASVEVRGPEPRSKVEPAAAPTPATAPAPAPAPVASSAASPVPAPAVPGVDPFTATFEEALRNPSPIVLPAPALSRRAQKEWHAARSAHHSLTR
jgi:hypothetical protein